MQRYARDRGHATRGAAAGQGCPTVRRARIAGISLLRDNASIVRLNALASARTDPRPSTRASFRASSPRLARAPRRPRRLVLRARPPVYGPSRESGREASLLQGGSPLNPGLKGAPGGGGACTRRRMRRARSRLSRAPAPRLLMPPPLAPDALSAAGAATRHPPARWTAPAGPSVQCRGRVKTCVT